jgi:hypothetical protein
MHLVGPVILIYYDAGQQNIKFAVFSYLVPWDLK